jgi:pimeloyl-ACP methyl ester carboxylesterase
VLRVPAAVTLDDFRACDAFDVMERLGEIAVPALVVVGALDELTPPRYARTLQERIPDAKLVEVADAGHNVMLERPQQVTRAIAAFLEGLGENGVVQ